jgi:putative peptide zinc metalloprotease protein
MATLADSLVSSSARKMPIRKRPDLTAQKQYYLGKMCWVVKDPVGLHYFRFQEEEYAILEMLDGQTSLDEIKERFEEEFPPQKITLEELHQFLGMLHRSGLILSGVPGQGQELLKRRWQRRKQQALAVLSNILCIRMRGIDPERFLDWLYGKTSWFFSRTAFACCILLMLAALSLIIVEFNVFRSKLPEFHQFFNLHNALWLTVTLAVSKILHEFGHGLTCKHFGGECHEMGLMILVLTPCLYCNVSDSWMLPNKWHRAAIGAAGMYVEGILAAICTFVWWYTSPGLINNLCLNIMFISSVSTVIFNGNPLLRYDGYYILADVMEIPNLRQKATQILSRKMSDWFLGIEQPDDPFLPQRNQVFFAAYSIASAIYRWVVVLSILMFLYKVWEPYRLEIIGSILGLMSLYGLLVYPLYQVGKFFYVPGRLDKVKKPRLYASIGGLAALLAVFFLVPFPHSLICTLEVQAHKASPIYVQQAGILEKLFVRSGQQVTAGQELAQLKNIDLDLKICDLSSQRDQYEMQLENLRKQRFTDPRAAGTMPQVASALKTVEGELKEKSIDRERLRLVAPVAGTVLPPPPTPKHEDPEMGLPRWSGIPLEPEKVGAFLEPGVLFCQIGDPRRLEAILVIDQTDIDYVKEGQRVDIKLDKLPHDTLESHITEIANADLKISSQRLSTKMGGELATKTDKASGTERPMSTSYQARVPIDDPDGLLGLGLRGRAKIHATWLPLSTRAWRFLTHMFNFRM